MVELSYLNLSCIYWFAGADLKAADISGMTAFDYIAEHSEWIDSGYFTEEVVAILKGEHC